MRKINRLKPTVCRICKNQPLSNRETTPQGFLQRLVCPVCPKKFSCSYEGMHGVIKRWETHENKIEMTVSDCSHCKISPISGLELEFPQKQRCFFSAILACPNCKKEATCSDVDKEKAYEILKHRWEKINEI